jgi:transposase-like protein
VKGEKEKEEGRRRERYDDEFKIQIAKYKI